MTYAGYARRVLSEDGKLLSLRLIGAQLEPGVYGSREHALHVYYVDTDEREQEIREAIAAQRPVPPPAAEASSGANHGAPPRPEMIAISGFAWKCYVEGQIAKDLRVAGQPSPPPEQREEGRS